MPRTRKSLLANIRDHANNAAWSEFQREYLPFIVYHAARLGIPRHAQEEIVQDVLLAVMRNRHRIQYRELTGSFRTWLKATTLSKAIDWFRRQRRSPSLLEGDQHPQVDTPHDPAPVEDSPQRQLMLQALAQVRQHVGSRTWRCFEEHVLKQRTAREVASDLCTSENAVYINSTRVMSRVRQLCLLHQRGVAHVQ